MRTAKHSSSFSSESLPPFSELLPSLNAHRQEIMRPVLDSPRKYVLFSLRKMAARLGCHPTTLLRILRAMGFAGFHDFQKYLHEWSIARGTSIDLVRVAKFSNEKTLLWDCLARDMENIRILRDSVDLARIFRVAKRIYSARRIIIVGADLASALTAFLHHALLVLDLPGFLAGSAGPTTYLAHNANRQDLVIAISFRHGLRQTVEGLKQAKANGAFCVGITDNFVSPIARYADEQFIVSTESASFASSYAAPMALLNLLLTACANCEQRRTLKILKSIQEEQRTGYRWYPETM